MSRFVEFRDEGFEYQEQLGVNGFEDQEKIKRSFLTTNKIDPLHSFSQDGQPFFQSSHGQVLPHWQMSPLLASSLVNENLFAEHSFVAPAQHAIAKEAAVLGGFVTAPRGFANNSNHKTAIFATLQSMAAGEETEYLGDPLAYLAIPVFDTFDLPTRRVVAILRSTILWRSYLTKILPSTVR